MDELNRMVRCVCLSSCNTDKIDYSAVLEEKLNSRTELSVSEWLVVARLKVLCGVLQATRGNYEILSFRREQQVLHHRS